MQQGNDKILKFQSAVGHVLKRLRKNKQNISINQFAREYDLDRGNLSKIEKGTLGCRLLTAWKIAEASDIKFSVFAKLLEDELGDSFKFYND